mgnify:CR=1 FL=1
MPISNYLSIFKPKHFLEGQAIAKSSRFVQANYPGRVMEFSVVSETTILLIYASIIISFVNHDNLFAIRLSK